MTPELGVKLLRLGKIGGAVGAIAAAIVGVAAALPLIEPYVVAHRGYVRFISMEATDKHQSAQIDSRKVVRDIQVEQAEGKMERVEEDLFKWAVELKKATDEQTKQLIADRIRDLKGTKRRLENQIDTLNKARFQ